MFSQSKRDKRIGEEKYNNQGSLMRIVEYIDHNNVIVEFQDKYKARVKIEYGNFIKGQVKNPYFPEVYGVGMVGNKYPVTIDGKILKEYYAWNNMIKRCVDEGVKNKHHTYQDVLCCEEWLLYENFYEWLHNQDNFDKWVVGGKWSIDKDVLLKNSKIYSAETCCLIPQNVNKLFTKRNAKRGDLPIGVTKRKDRYVSQCNNPITNKKEYLGMYPIPETAFQAYKKRKEEIIKQVAKIEYESGNITKRCYDAMMKYEVEITD